MIQSKWHGLLYTFDLVLVEHALHAVLLYLQYDLVSFMLLSTTKERQCFHKHLSFCQQEGLAWWGRDMHGRRHAWQGGLHDRGMCGRLHAWQVACVVCWRDSHCSRQYASYWNAFLLMKIFTEFRTLREIKNLPLGWAVSLSLLSQRITYLGWKLISNSSQNSIKSTSFD